MVKKVKSIKSAQKFKENCRQKIGLVIVYLLNDLFILNI